MALRFRIPQSVGIMIGTASSLIAASVSAQVYPNVPAYSIPSNHSFSGIYAATGGTPAYTRKVDPRLTAFGRCIVDREPAATRTLRVAYGRHDSRAVSTILAGLKPTIASCHRQTRAPGEAGLRQFQLAAIGDALREHAGRAG